MIDQLKPFKAMVVKLAAYYEKTLEDQQVQVLSEQLYRNLTTEECSQACKLYIDDPKNEFFPRPISKLIALIKSPVSNEDLSQNQVAVLLEAERKHGVHWTEGFFQGGEKIFKGKDCAYLTWENAALSEFGELGLRIVNSYGGWEKFCLTVNESPDGVIRAQLLKQSNALQNIQQRTGSFEALPSSGSTAAIDQAGKVLQLVSPKSIPEGS